MSEPTEQVSDEQISAANEALWKCDNWTASYNGMRAALHAALSAAARSAVGEPSDQEDSKC